MSKNPFDYVKSINHKQYEHDLSGYNPFLTNRCFAMHMDTILLAEELNQYSTLSPYLQYEFYYHSVRKGKRFGYPPKVVEPPHLNLVTEYFQVSKVKALEILNILTEQDISDIMNSMNTGGNQ